MTSPKAFLRYLLGLPAADFGKEVQLGENAVPTATPILVLANKQDKESSLTSAQVAEALALETVCQGREWLIQEV